MTRSTTSAICRVRVLPLAFGIRTARVGPGRHSALPIAVRMERSAEGSRSRRSHGVECRQGQRWAFLPADVVGDGQ